MVRRQALIRCHPERARRHEEQCWCEEDARELLPDSVERSCHALGFCETWPDAAAPLLWRAGGIHGFGLLSFTHSPFHSKCSFPKGHAIARASHFVPLCCDCGPLRRGQMCGNVFTVRAAFAARQREQSLANHPANDRQDEHDTQTQPDPATPVLLQYDCTISQNYTRGFLHVASSSLVLCCEGTGNVCFATDTLTRGISHAQCAATTTCLWRRLGGLATDYLACFRLCSCPCRHVETLDILPRR